MTRRRAPVPEEDSAGLQSVGDLMAGLLLLFMLLAMVFAMSLSRTEQVRVVEIDALTRTAADQQDLQLEIVDHLTSAGVPVTLTNEPGVMRLGEGAIRFAPGRHSSDDPVTLSALDRLAAVLAETLPDYACSAEPDGCPHPPVAALESVLIEGHSDTVDRLDDCDNHCLSARRASWTRAQLLARRVASSLASLPALGRLHGTLATRAAGPDHLARRSSVQWHRRLHLVDGLPL